MDEIINESQVLDFICYNIQETAKMNGIAFEEAVENVRYYMDYLVDEAASFVN